MNAEAYLNRISYRGPIRPGPEILRELHIAHMRSVPFENLDIQLGIPIELSLPHLFGKVVERNRGGFCYELNGLFCWLLREIGYEVEMLSARVFGGEGEPGPEFDHMLLRVDRDYIADVGFGDSFTEPLRFSEGVQDQATGKYRIVESAGRLEMQRDRGEGWIPQYDFTETPREMEEYVPMCIQQQTDSIFTRKKVCTKATSSGRITFSDGRLIESRDGDRRERGINSAEELRGVFSEVFGFELESGYRKLMDT